MDIRTEMFMNEDSQGNKLYMRVNIDENNTWQNAILHLKLKSENHPRLLGNVVFSTRTFYCKRKSSKHYHHKMKGYGFNWSILEDPTLFIRKIHLVVDDTERYEFDKSLIQNYGKFLNFKEQGFELQRFLSFDIIKQHAKKDGDGKAE